MVFRIFIIYTFFISIFYREFSKINIPAPVPGGKLYVAEIFILLCLITILASHLINRTFKKPISQKRNRIFYGAFFFYFLFALFALVGLVNGNFSQKTLMLRDFASFYYSTIYVITCVIINDKIKKEKIIKVIIISTSFACLLIIFRSLLGMGNINSTGEMRFGNYETVGIIFVFCWMFTKPINEWTKYNWILIAVLVFIVAVLINHRSSIVALMVSLFVVCFLNYKNEWSGFSLLFIKMAYFSVFALIIIFIINQDILNSVFYRLNTILNPMSEVNASWRLFTWKIALSDMEVTDWLLGKGWGWQISSFFFNKRGYGLDNEIIGLAASLATLCAILKNF